eukprot:scaffold7282_cov113-Isochrysis_galbana.AAC.2
MTQEARRYEPQLNDGATDIAITAGRLSADRSITRRHGDGFANFDRRPAANDLTSPRGCCRMCGRGAPAAMLRSNENACIIVASTAEGSIAMLG